jgi:hypothetical protein
MSSLNLKTPLARRARVAIIGIRIASCGQKRAVTDQLDKAVSHPLRRLRIGDAASQPLGNTELALDLGQENHTGIRGRPPAVKGNLNRLVGNG